MKYDIIVVGSGPGGYVAAIRASQLGRKVALVERAEAGGVCLNWGCIPTKALLKSAQVYTYCKSAAHYGLDLTGEVKPDLEKIVARSRGVAETMSKGVAFLLGKNNIDLIPGFGRLTAPGKLDVDGTEYEADHIVLATGARPREMAFMPIDGDVIIHIAPAGKAAAVPYDKIEAFSVPKGTMVMMHAGVWHAAPFACADTPVHILVFLPERTYANDCSVVLFPEEEKLELEG